MISFHILKNLTIGELYSILMTLLKIAAGTADILKFN